MIKLKRMNIYIHIYVSLLGLFTSTSHYQQMEVGYSTYISTEKIIDNLPNVPNQKEITYFNTRLDLMQVDKIYAVNDTAFGVEPPQFARNRLSVSVKNV